MALRNKVKITLQFQQLSNVSFYNKNILFLFSKYERLEQLDDLSFFNNFSNVNPWLLFQKVVTHYVYKNRDPFMDECFSILYHLKCKSKGFFKTLLQFIYAGASNTTFQLLFMVCSCKKIFNISVNSQRSKERTWPYHPECIPSHLIMEVKRDPAWLKRGRKKGRERSKQKLHITREK